ncbi:unnamed protein product [Moneuplotes crassus]|uniref:Phosphoglycerate mutase n=1 Tax=Euplotes crassus TaxID=5936 RepID=A0AAD1XV41_EUPCR|nr:unnamed protein product [Moneuplotes crassus]
MRHGERSDWSGKKVKRRGDTTLTSQGHVQAYQTGKYIKKFLKDKEIKNFRVYSSPLVRTIQTSCEVSKALKNSSIKSSMGFVIITIHMILLKLDEVELHSMDISEFREHYIPKSKVEIEDNEDYIEEMNETYPEENHLTGERVVRHSEHFIDELKNSEDIDAIIAISHWDIVEKFSEYYGNDYKPMDYCALSCLEINLENDENELVLDRHIAYS